MEVVIRQHEQQCGVTAADIFADAVTSGATTLGLATGSSPLSVYRELIRRHRQEGLTFAAIQAFLLDEYVGLPPSHPQSYAHVIRAEFTDHIDIDSERVYSPNGFAEDIFTAAAEYDALIADAGPVDVQLLAHRQQRAHRIQRAGIVIGVSDPGQDPDRADLTRQRPVLHRDQRGAPPRHYPGTRNHLRWPPPRAHRDGRSQGGGRRGSRRRSAYGKLPCVGPPTPSARHARGRRPGSRTTQECGLLSLRPEIQTSPTEVLNAIGSVQEAVQERGRSPSVQAQPETVERCA